MKKNIHFICSGNVFRSRLAEAYINSLELQNIKGTSSGIIANQNTNGPIGWFAAKIVKKYGLVDYLKPFWDQTTQECIDTSNIIIFMTKDNLTQTKKQFNLDKKSIDVWNIKDLSDFGYTSDFMDSYEEVESIKTSEKIFADIKFKINELVNKLQTSNH